MKTPDRASIVLIVHQSQYAPPPRASVPLLEYGYVDEVPPEIERVLRANRQSEAE